MTVMKSCNDTDGRILAANHNKHISIEGRHGIIQYNRWTEFGESPKHQVGFDELNGESVSSGPASDDCQKIMKRLFFKAA